MERESPRHEEIPAHIAHADTIDSGTRVLGSDATLKPHQAEAPRRSVSKDRRTDAQRLAVSRQIEQAKRGVRLDDEAERNRILQDPTELFEGASFVDIVYRLDKLSRSGVIDLPIDGKRETVFSLMHKVNEVRGFSDRWHVAKLKKQPMAEADMASFFDQLGLRDRGIRAALRDAILADKPPAPGVGGKIDWSDWWDEKTGKEK